MHHTMQGRTVRTTLNIDDELLDLAARLTGTSAKTTLVRLGLEALIARESAKRLARLGAVTVVLGVLLTSCGEQPEQAAAPGGR